MIFYKISRDLLGARIQILQKPIFVYYIILQYNMLKCFEKITFLS
jgi:hypothetical protein